MSSPSSDRIVPSPGVRRALNFGWVDVVASITPKICHISSDLIFSVLRSYMRHFGEETTVTLLLVNLCFKLDYECA